MSIASEDWARTLTPSVRRRMRVLVVDDHQFVRHIVTQILTSAEIRDVVHASSGSDAIRIMETGGTDDTSALAERLLHERPDIASDLQITKTSFDCVVSDFSMEPVNGLDLLKMVRDGTLGQRRDLPFILLTGHSEDYVIATALELDVSAFVVKPVSREKLLSRLARVIARPPAVKLPEAYAAVSVPSIEGSHGPRITVTGRVIKKTVEEEQAEHIAELKKRKRPPMVQVAVDKLWKGAVVAKDVRGPSGAVLLKEGTVISGLALAQFQDVVEMEDLEGTIWVYAK